MNTSGRELQIDSWCSGVVAARVFLSFGPRYNQEGFRIKTMQFTRITIDPGRMGGVPCIRDLRIPVATVVEMVADGMDAPQILTTLPDLEADDIREALRFAAEAVRERELPLLSNR